MTERVSTKVIEFRAPEILQIDLKSGECRIGQKNTNRVVIVRTADLQKSLLQHRIDFRPRDLFRDETRLRVPVANAEYSFHCTNQQLLQLAQAVFPQQSPVDAKADQFARWTAKTIPGAQPFWRVAGGAYDAIHSVSRGLMGSPQPSRRTEVPQQTPRAEERQPTALQRSLPPEVLRRDDVAVVPDLFITSNERMVFSKGLTLKSEQVSIQQPLDKKGDKAQVDTVTGELTNGKSRFDVFMATTGGRRTEKTGGQDGNEDAVMLAEYVLPNGTNVALALVCDGVGGIGAGEIASETARDKAKGCMNEICRGGEHWHNLVRRAENAIVRHAIVYKNYSNVEILGHYIASYLLEEMQRKVVNIQHADHSTGKQPKTTVVGALIIDGYRPTMFHGGDSRGRIRDASGNVLNYTEDHTTVQRGINERRFVVGQTQLTAQYKAVDGSHILGPDSSNQRDRKFSVTLPHDSLVQGYTQPMVYLGPEIPVGGALDLYTDGIDDVQPEQKTLTYGSPLDKAYQQIGGSPFSMLKKMTQQLSALMGSAISQGQDNTTLISLRRTR